MVMSPAPVLMTWNREFDVEAIAASVEAEEPVPPKAEFE
jgi:hypothetical protein